MFGKIKKAVNLFLKWLFVEENTNNIYCIPCKWEISGHVYVSASNLENAKVYVKTHPVVPVLEENMCYEMLADTTHPVLCTCGNCGTEYVVSTIHNPKVCPKCGNGNEPNNYNRF